VTGPLVVLRKLTLLREHVARARRRRPDTFATLERDVDHAVLDRELSRQLAAIAAVRNRIAHGYASVELERLWRELPDGLAALERYAAPIAEYVERRDGSST
jgi:uncharacterized protein YutE (UPF0331/DUF86 family)